jgi:hypothetical protein
MCLFELVYSDSVHTMVTKLVALVLPHTRVTNLVALVLSHTVTNGDLSIVSRPDLRT